MSSLEGLLLEPFVPSIGLPLSLSGLTASGLEITATSSSVHGLVPGDFVEISGVTGDGVQWWNGVFVVYQTPTTTQFKYRAYGAPPGSAGYSSGKVTKLLPREVFIADLPGNSRLGAGTITDPFNGTAYAATGLYAAKSVSSLTRSGRIATVTSSGHGIAAGEWVTLVGVQLTTYAELVYMGTFIVKEADVNTFSYVMLGEPATSPAIPESTGSIQCWRERERLDQVLRRLPGNSVIILSPGTFFTKGAREGNYAGGWELKRGQVLRGSGMGITMLKLVHAVALPPHNQLNAVVYNNNTAFPGKVECSDFTVDCNVDGQASRFSNCGAVVIRFAMGHCRIRRVEMFNFASKGPTATYNENFPLYLDGESIDCAIEDCIATSPSPNAIWNSTIIHMSGRGNQSTGTAVRNNYIDARFKFGGDLAWVRDIEVDGLEVTLTTARPHGLTFPGKVSVSGVYVGFDPDSNRYNGVFKIDSIPADNQIVYTVFPDENSTAPEIRPETVVNSPVLPYPIRISLMEAVNYNDPPTLAATCMQPHNLVVGDQVIIGNVFLNNEKVPECNGVFRVVEVTGLNQFQFILNSKPDVSPPWSFTPSDGNAMVCFFPWAPRYTQ